MSLPETAAAPPGHVAAEPDPVAAPPDPAADVAVPARDLRQHAGVQRVLTALAVHGVEPRVVGRTTWRIGCRDAPCLEADAYATRMGGTA